MISTLVLMEGHNHAVVSKDELEVKHRAGTLQFEDVHPLSGDRRLQASGRLLGGEVGQEVAGGLLVQANVQAPARDGPSR
jgi:hypothetical protein